MRNSQIKLGKIDCPLIWARVASQMKLIRKNSDIYSELIKVENQKELPNISAKNLKVNGIYETANGEQFVYGGEVEFFSLVSKHSNSDHIIYWPPSEKTQFPLEITKIKRKLWISGFNDNYFFFNIIKGDKSVKKYLGQKDECLNKLILQNKEFVDKYYLNKTDFDKNSCLYFSDVDNYFEHSFVKIGDELELLERFKKYLTIKE